MINVAIIGAGRIGRVHAENITAISSRAKVSAIVDPYLNDDIIKWANSLCIYKCLTDYRDVLNDKSIDAVLICSSTHTHAAISIEAIKAGKNVFCEKPVDHDIVKIKEVMAALKDSSVKYQVGFNRRFDHNYRAAKVAYDEGRVGRINVLKITSRDPEPPCIDYVKVSGGLFLDMAIHDFDMARYISGVEVDEVFAYGTNLVDSKIGEAGDIDTAIVSMKMADGSLAVIDNCRRSSYGYDQRLEIFGEKGQISIGNDSCANISVSTDNGVVFEKPYHFFLERYKEAYALELKEFFDCIQNDSQVPVGIIDGLMDVIVGLACKESLKTNAPVAISDIMAQYDL